jgi:hypothetical protein
MPKVEFKNSDFVVDKIINSQFGDLAIIRDNG